MKNINEIVPILASLSEKSKADQAHFDFLMGLIAANNFEAAARHITKYDSKSEYQQQLQALLPHVQVKSKEDAASRLGVLMDAINSGDSQVDKYERVREALETGSAVVINKLFQQPSNHLSGVEISPLFAAIATGDKRLIKMLLSCGATLDNIRFVNVPLNRSHETALHIACRLKMHDLTVMLLAKGAEVNITDGKGWTPLHVACENNDEEAALLLLNKKADPENYFIDHAFREITPFLIAIEMKNVRLVKAMLDHGYHVNKLDRQRARVFYKQNGDPKSEEIYNLLKPGRVRKNAIKRASQVNLFAHPDKNLEALFNILHVEDIGLKSQLLREITSIYNDSNEILKPLLHAVAMAAQSKHEAGQSSQKKLSIVINQKKDISDLVLSEEVCDGAYTGKNSVFIAGGRDNLNSLVGIILHELKHFVDNQVYGDTKKPYRPAHETHFLAVKAKLQENIAAFEAKIIAKAGNISEEDKLDVRIYAHLAVIFNLYSADNRDAEIMVKVPEIIGYLGVAKGVAWLEQHEPALLAFYKIRFNEACKSYLNSQQAPVSSVAIVSPKPQ